MIVIEASECSGSARERDVVRSERVVSPFEVQARALSRLAALFHDLGKSTEWFQRKLRRADVVKKPVADLVRHEFISFVVISALFEDFPNDRECLVAMSDPDVAAVRIERAFKLAFEKPDRYAFGEREAERLAVFSRIITRASGTDARDINYADFEHRPVLALLSDAVLTHHRLTGARFDKKADRVVATVEALVRNFDRPSDFKKEDLELHFKLPPKLTSIWKDAGWVSEVSKACASLATILGKPVSRKAFSIVGRAALVLGDHKASAFGNQSLPAEGTVPSPLLIYANTNRGSRSGELAESLSGHLVRVSKDCDLAYDILFGGDEAFPGIGHDDLPIAVSEPRAERGTAYRWQTDASRATRKALTLRSGAGFFGVLMADTGAGKTRGASVIMAAATSRSESVRLSVCSGLRTLTLQTGREYTEELRFPSDSVSVVIGDEITADLYRNEVRLLDTGSETDDLVGVNVVPMANCDNDRPLPRKVHAFVGDSLASATARMLAAPVLVSTIDTIMSVADGRRAGQMAKTLRAMTADLIIDEIDNFGAEDIVAISRLVFVHGAFGRRMLISSATVYPEIANSLFKAYSEGWEVHRAITDSNAPVIAGWYSNQADSRCVEITGQDAFVETHSQFVSEILNGGRVVRRLPRVSAPVEIANARAYFRSVSSEIPKLHEDNAVIDAKTGRRISVGVIKWNNALPSILYATRLTQEGLGPEHEVFVVPYNGTLQAGPRHIVETTLNRMLKRKSRIGADPILSDPTIRDLLDNRAVARDVVLIVVTTSMEETGRDHDFDWAILEPGSQRSLIQIAGRVRRHRPEGYLVENVVIMERAFREVRNHELRTPSAPVFAYPGFETPNGQAMLKLKLAEHSAAACYDMLSLSRGIDARDAISTELPTASIASSERRLTAAYLDGSYIADKAGVTHFLSDDMAFIHGHNMAKRRFRRSTGTDYTFVYQADQRRWGVVVDHVVQNCGNVTDLEPDESRLLIQMETEEVLRDRLASELWGDGADIDTWRAHSLLAVVRPQHEKSAHASKFLYHRTLGFVEIPGWLDKLDLLEG